MKKLISKISVGLIFLMFGFVIITQLKTMENQKVGPVAENEASPEILIENEQLKKEKEELEKKVKELTDKADSYENAAAENTESDVILEELQKTRMKAGLTDVEGQGIIVYINPKTMFLETSSGKVLMNDFDLLTIVNELFASGAEAISINDIRITGNSAIRSATNNIYIFVNNERISTQSQVVIKAIGNKNVLESTMKFPDVISNNLKTSCDVSFEGKDSISINKSNSKITYEYIKGVE